MESSVANHQPPASPADGARLPSGVIAAALPVGRWTITLHPKQALPPIPHTGSMLRGILGHALRARTCHCQGNGHQSDCLYQQLFKPIPAAGTNSRFSDIPPPFVITPSGLYPGGGAPLRFHFTFWGAALFHRDLLAECWQQAGQTGLDPGRVPADCRIYRQNPALPTPPAGPTIGLRFTSPLLVKRRGAALAANQIGALDIFHALARRMTLLQAIYRIPTGDLPTDWISLAEKCQVHSSLQQVRYQRYSNRQQQAIPLEGAVGTLWLHGPIPDGVRQAMAIGQWLHIGGKTALGMGAYQLLDPDSPQMNLTLEAAS